MSLTYMQLDDAATRTKVRDSDGDVWIKNAAGTWDVEAGMEVYSGWSSVKLVDRYTVNFEDTPEIVAEPMIEGVWIVWDGSSKEYIRAVFPVDGEINALRKVNRDGYGHAEFQPFGEV
jgi:hypothetical protein